MTTFLTDSNNGFVAVITEEDALRLKAHEEPRFGVFIFTNHPVTEREPWIAGNIDLMHRLLGGHSVAPAYVEVDFSNGHHLYTTRDGLLAAFRRIGSLSEAIEVFGLVTGHEVATSGPLSVAAA